MKIKKEGLKHGYVVSDLHIFTKWSSIDKYMSDIRKAASDAAFFVFNGDIFDFRWSTLKSANKTAKAAVEWLKVLCTDFPECDFFYVLGNHDCHVKLVKELKELAEVLDNFHWNDSYFRIGTALFMHGDLIFKMKQSSPFTRKKFKKREPRNKVIGSSYHIAIEMGAHNVASKIYYKRRCAKRTLKAINRSDSSKLEGITDIYIGHTHVAYSDLKYRGYTFHNSGSAVHDLHCNILKVVSESQKQ